MIQWQFEGIGAQNGRPHGLYYTACTDFYDLEIRKVDLGYHWFVTRRNSRLAHTISSLDANPDGFTSPIDAQRDCDRWLNRKRIV